MHTTARRLLAALVGLVQLGGLLALGEVDVGRHLRAHVVPPVDRLEDRQDALDVAAFHLPDVIELIGVQARGR